MNHESGLSLIESLVGLLLIGFGVMAAAPMFIYAIQGSAVGGDTSLVGTVAVERMEQFRAMRFNDLLFGGDLDADVATVVNYFDNSHPDVTLRWRIDDNSATLAGSKIITLRAVARRDSVSGPRVVTLTTMRGL